MTAVKPPGRYGALTFDPSDPKTVRQFCEKPDGDGGYINGGFFVLQNEVIDLIAEDQTIWEREPLEYLANQGQLNAYFHSGFWQPMDTLRDKNQLEAMWSSGTAPWRTWPSDSDGLKLKAG